MQKALFVSGKRKYLFCADQNGMEILQPVIDLAVAENAPYEIYSEEQPLIEWLKKQKMGCYLYVAAEWAKLVSLKKLTEEVGFSEEEARYIGYGKRWVKVFCCRCHGITEVILQEKQEIACSECDLLLEVSDHYSTLKNAYLGYVAKL
ncbi:dimethylamine monooxygenase subunit DmmA family protein [Neobacillus bataviensis]|uniref:dimethylamine monooxygenase subunit DmmA family protein n=1 Tax=Neobacillus bataviensis TaxID=220685 RepID=UPI001CC09F93|nr:dimethylamine monooxygenase subunit DmmA family protein [Neobacillus bataviensis]